MMLLGCCVHYNKEVFSVILCVNGICGYATSFDNFSLGSYKMALVLSNLLLCTNVKIPDKYNK